MANNGKEDADEINRCITRLTGSEVFKNKKYAIEEAIKENAIGIFNKNKINNRTMGKYTSTGITKFDCLRPLKKIKNGRHPH